MNSTLAAQTHETFELKDVRTDGWFEQLAGEENFQQLCEVVGERFVAFSFIAGIRIVSIGYDRTDPESSTVDFKLPDSEEVQSFSLSEFRQRLGAAVLTVGESVPELSPEPDSHEIRRYIGRRYLLLAPIFGVELLELRRYPDGRVSILVDLGAGSEEMSFEDFRYTLGEAVRDELRQARRVAPFAIDFNRVPLAQAANREGNYLKTIELLGAWPDPLAMFLRSAQGQALGQRERGMLATALGVLGEAYMHAGEIDWAEDVLRLGIQWAQESEAAGPLFLLLGRACVANERPGQAIGLLRRSLQLGAPEKVVLPALASCYLERKRYVAAAACADKAIALGVDLAELVELRQRVTEHLGSAYSRYEQLMAGGTGD